MKQEPIQELFKAMLRSLGMILSKMDDRSQKALREGRDVRSKLILRPFTLGAEGRMDLKAVKLTLGNQLVRAAPDQV